MNDGSSQDDISGREQLSAELMRLRSEIREAEHRLHLTLDAAAATGGWDWDIAGGVLFGDASFAMLTGHDPVELAKGTATNKFFNNIVPEDQKRIRLAVAAMLVGAEVFEKDYRLTKSDGGTRWVHAKGRAILDANDEPARFVGNLVDVTEQMRFQEQLRIAQSSGAIGTFDHVDGFGTVTVSEQFCRLLGLHPTRVLPVSTLNQLVHPEDRPIIEPMSPQTPNENPNVEFRIIRADTGEARWLARRGEYVRDLARPGLRYIGVAYDITASKLNEERLQRLNENLSETVKDRTRDRDRIWQNSRDLLAVIVGTGSIIDANPAWLEVLGTQSVRLVGKSILDFAWPEDAARIRTGIELSLAENGVAFEGRLVHADGNPRWISWTASSEGETIYLYGRHVSVEREQASALREAEALLRQSQKMEAVGQLTGGIAHDFNNMLTGIIGALEIIRRRIAAGQFGGLDRFMDAAIASAQRAAGLTHRLLAFSRRQPLDRKPTDVSELILGMRDLLDRSLGEQVRLTVTIAPDCWLAITDDNQLENALLNLAINARDAMPGGGVLSMEARNIRVKRGQIPALDAAETQEFVAITVRDNGVGMAPDVLDKAFEPFFTTKPIGQGTGLGLSMVYGFAQQSGGGIDVESTLGAGTAITLYLPRSTIARAEADQAAAQLPVGTGERVLVVEDDPSVRMLVVEVLRDLGYSALEAVDATTATVALEKNPHLDLLISDVGLPGMNGRQLAEIAREIIPHLPVLFMTGYAANAVNKEAFLAEGMHMISKPFDIDEFAIVIHKILDANKNSIRPSPMPIG